MVSLKAAAVALICAGALILSSAIILSSTLHSVNCAGGRIKIDSRIQSETAEQAGCFLGGFETREGADAYALRLGGEGSACCCGEK